MHVHLENERGGGGGEIEKKRERMGGGGGGGNGCKADFNRWVKVKKYSQQAWLHTKGSN